MARKRNKAQAQATDTPAPGPDNDSIPVLTDTPFAIFGDGFSRIQAAVDDLGTVQAIMARPGVRMEKTEYVKIRGTVAVVEVIGPIFHYDNIMSWIFGWPAAEQLIMELEAVQNNPAVQSIVLHIDSPGGQVGGVAELAAHIKNRITKPVVAYVGDMGASAAYWIASAADMIIANETAEVGSIGVVMTMRRGSDNQIEIVSSVSPKKRPDPNTDAGRAVLQARADNLAEVFVNTIMMNRGMTRDQVLEIGGDVVIASRAVTLGLIDDIGNLEPTIEALQNGGIEKPARQTQEKGVVKMNLEKLKADHPDLYAQVMDLGRAEVQAKMDTALAQAETDKTEAVTAAQASTIEMVEVVLGKESKEKLDKVLASGMTPDQVKTGMELFGGSAQGGQSAQTQTGTTAAAATRQQILDGITAGAQPPAPPVNDDGSDPDPAAEFMALVDDHQTKNNCKRSVSIEAVAAAHPETYQGWLAAQQKK
jgi:ClpP class serine protease